VTVLRAPKVTIETADYSYGKIRRLGYLPNGHRKINTTSINMAFPINSMESPPSIRCPVLAALGDGALRLFAYVYNLTPLHQKPPSLLVLKQFAALKLQRQLYFYC